MGCHDSQHNDTSHNDRIMGSFATLSIIDTCHKWHKSILCYAECHDYLNVTLSVIMLIVVVLSVILLNVVMLNVEMLNGIMLNGVMLRVVAPSKVPNGDKNTLLRTKSYEQNKRKRTKLRALIVILEITLCTYDVIFCRNIPKIHS